MKAFSVEDPLMLMRCGANIHHIPLTTATWNIVVSSSPKSFVGISVGVGALLLFIGMSIGPALTGVYMENHQTIKGVQGSYPFLELYNLVYLISGLLSTVSLGFALILRRAAQKAIEV